MILFRVNAVRMNVKVRKNKELKNVNVNPIKNNNGETNIFRMINP
jgi:hypothetical protein